MKKNYFTSILVIISICLSVSLVNAQCPNADFSFGNFSNWTGSTGYYSLGIYHPYGGMIIGTTNSNTYATDSGRQTLITQSQTDPETQNQLNELSPGGGFAARLGNCRTASCDTGKAQEEELSYTYRVNPSNCIFTYEYAVVLHDPGNSANHTALTRPKFTVSVLDSTGVLIDSACGYYEVVAQQGNPGFISCAADPADACDNSDQVVWRNWTSVNINLMSYIGQNITIQFTTRDCNPNENPGRHFGYAYITCNCSALQLTEHCSSGIDTITAPSGYALYKWNIDSTQNSPSIIVNNPITGTIYTCTCTSVSGCTFIYQDTCKCGTVNIYPTINLLKEFDIFPNPASDFIQVRSENEEVRSVEIYNMLGEEVYQSLVTGHSSFVNSQSSIGVSPMTNAPFTIDIANLPSGVYVIEVRTVKGVEVKKFVKE
jgi:hypothetical protein